MSDQKLWKAQEGHWTDRLKQLQADHLSASKIAKIISVEAKRSISRNAIIGRLKRLGLPLLGQLKGRPRPRQLSAVPPRSAFNPGHPKGRQSDHCFGVANKIKPWNPPALTPDEKEFILGKSKLSSLKRLLDFDDLPSKPRYCRWPINDPEVTVISSFQKIIEPYLFCGQTAVAGCPYCGYHARMAYGRGTPSERRATEAG